MTHLQDFSVMQNRIRTDLAIRLEIMSDQQVEAAFRACEIDFGATHVPPDQRRWGPVEHEICLLGISARGYSLGAAVRQWIKCALRTNEAFREMRHSRGAA